MRALLVLGLLGVVTACTANEEDSSASASTAAVSQPVRLDCSQLGSFPEAAMKAVGDGTYVRAGAAPANALQSFTLGTLEDVPGWGGKTVSYTRDMTTPCLDFRAIGDGSGMKENRPLPMTTEGCAGQKGKATVIMDNPAIGAFIAFDDESGLPFAKDGYFVTASQLDAASGKVTALCLANASNGDRFLVTRQ